MYMYIYIYIYMPVCVYTCYLGMYLNGRTQLMDITKGYMVKTIFLNTIPSFFFFCPKVSRHTDAILRSPLHSKRTLCGPAYKICFLGELYFPDQCKT